jgi:hypothetical protein
MTAVAAYTVAPRPPGWFARVWPPLTGRAAAPAVVAVAIAGLIAAWALVFDRPGFGWLLVGLAMASTAIVSRRSMRRDKAVAGPDTDPGAAAGPGTAADPGTQAEPGPRQSDRRRGAEQVAWGIASLALLGVGAVRADGWLFFWCVCGALGCGSVALAGGRTIRGLTAGSVALAIAARRAFPWWARGVVGVRPRASSGIRLGRTIGVTAGLLVVFGALFTTADPAFARILTGAIPTVNGRETGRAIVALLGAGAVAMGVAYLASGKPPFHDLESAPARTVRRTEWAVPLAVLDLLFLAFVLVQLASLFGGRGRVLRTAGLTYAEYARTGFWQLLVLAGLTLVVIGMAVRVAPRVERADRLFLRVLLGTLAGLTLVIVASALHRLAAYDSAYGYTRLRLAVGVTEGWLGLVFLLVMVAGVGLRAGWLPRVAAASAVCALLATAVVGPDQFIAAQDVARYQRTGQIDTIYLSALSADAAPALSRLPEPLRERVLASVECRIEGQPDDWRSWNAGRSRARALIGPGSLASRTCLR